MLGCPPATAWPLWLPTGVTPPPSHTSPTAMPQPLPPGHTPCHAPSASLPLAEQASMERVRAGQAHASMECMENEMGPF